MTDADIAVFILARTAEREEKARQTASIRGRDWVARPVMTPTLRVGSGEWTPEITGTEVCGDGSATWHPFYFKSAQAADGVVAEFLALNDPAAVLARCAADRRLVAEHHEVWHTSIQGLSPMNAYLQKGRLAGLYRALQYLALPYADHPDYDKDWKP